MMLSLDSSIGIGMSLTQYCSESERHERHSPQDQAFAPTPTVSPTLIVVTFGPIFTALPTISWPTMQG